jgi:hypothetical protein
LKKTEPIILPPLSVETLANIEIVERTTAKKIKECAGYDFDLAKAIRHIRTFAVAAFNWQINYYASLPDFNPNWSIAILEETTTIIMGAIPRGTQSLLPADKSRIKHEIRTTLARHILALEQRKHKRHSDGAASRIQKQTPAKKQRKVLQPNHELLKDITATLSRIKAAEALGMSPRNFDRLKKTKKVVPIGPTDRKRYRVRDLLLLVERKY